MVVSDLVFLSISQLVQKVALKELSSFQFSQKFKADFPCELTPLFQLLFDLVWVTPRWRAYSLIFRILSPKVI